MEAGMSKVRRSGISGRRAFRTGPSRRSVLSIFPAALFGGWLAVGRRSNADGASPEIPALAPPVAPEEAAGMSNCTHRSKVTDAETYSYDAWTTVVTYDEQGRVVDQRTFSPGGHVRCYHYDYYDATKTQA